MHKTCSICSEEKHITEFYKDPKKINGCKHECKICYDERDKRYYQKNKHKIAERIKNRKSKIRKYIYDYLLSHPCVDCGESNPIVLEFDHVGEKTINISEIRTYGWSTSRIDKEISQCQIRCANCHKIKTAREQGWYKDLL